MIKESGLKRLKDSDRKKKEENGYRMTFPTKEEVNFALRFETFDLPPYSKESSCNFRNMLEGFVNTTIGYRLPNAHSLHNQVHVVIGGIMSTTPSASNDPIFPLHHSYADRVFEKWLRKYKKDSSALSSNDAPIGHNRGDVIVLLFPVYIHEQMFMKSFEFGYDYEEVDEDGKCFYYRSGLDVSTVPRSTKHEHVQIMAYARAELQYASYTYGLLEKREVNMVGYIA